MRAILENPLWLPARKDRTRQRRCGLVSGLCFAIALVAMLDGLIAQMRAGSNELEMLPGQRIALSGPAALKNPVDSDVIARFSPEDAPLAFELEGFFTGYWFGSGMWRGQVIANDDASPGSYELKLSFRGASAKTAQIYKLDIFANAHDMQAASLSLIRRFLGFNPFILAASFTAAALLLGLFTYIYGRKYDGKLRKMGLAQVWTANRGELACLLPKDQAPAPGNVRMVLDSEARAKGEAKILNWEKGKLRLRLLDECDLPPDALICLKHPANPTKKTDTSA